jgi:hypothetical protein
MRRLTIGIGQYAYQSSDRGTTWARSLREVPGRHTPVVQGDADLYRLPPRPERTSWDFVTVLRCGFGVAVDHQFADDTRSVASVFLTEDGGQQWRPLELKVNWPGLLSKRPASWPVEKFASLALPTPGCIALAWDDPWLYDGSQSHVICSFDRGESWEYCCLGESNPYLAEDYRGRLLALNDGYYLESPDGGRTWTRRPFAIEWPVEYCHRRVALLRQLTFPQPGTGYALVVHWRHGRMNEPPADVGLLVTTDGGERWGHLHVFEGPNIGDVNERHVLDLRVN